MYKLKIYLFIFYNIINMIYALDQLRIINADYLESIKKNNQTIQNLHGNVILQNNDLTLFTEDANFYPKTDEFHLINDVIMIKDQDTMKCNQIIYFNGENSFLKAIGNVSFVQTNQSINCDSLYYWSDLDSSIAYQNVKMIQKNTIIQSDQLSFWKTSGYRGSSFIAKGNCKINDNNKTILANKIIYNDTSQLMSLIDNCNINEIDRGISGNKIQIQYLDSLIQSAEVFDQASAYNDIWAIINKKQKYRDTMFSQKLYSKFSNNKINELTLFGMASTSYHVLEDSILKGLNNASGDTIKINFINDAINRLQIFGGGQGKYSPKNNNNVDSTIIYKADYIDYHIPDKKTFLNTNASVDYQDTYLASGYITADWKKNILEVFKQDDSMPIVNTNNGDPLSGDYMEFNLISKHGRIVKGKTTFNKSLYYGNEIYRDDPNIFHVKSSKYTSCDSPEPHFYLASKKMKMITGDRVVAKPLWLFIFDIPIIGFPLAVFPNKGGQRHSGWIMPSFGHRNSDGTFFQGLGYYWAPNNYLDSRFMMNFYDKKGIKTFSTINYVKRYKYNGSLNSTLSRTIFSNNISNIINGNLNQKWDLKWRHNWKIDPYQNFNINWTYMSNNSYYQDTTFSHTQETRLNQRLESSANYSKQWPESKNSLSINISESIDLLNSQKSNLDINPIPNSKIIYKSTYLPRLSLRRSQSKIFGNGSRWYNNAYWSISTSMTRLEKTGWEADSNSIWQPTNIKDNTDEIVSHSIVLSAPQKFWGWLTLNPKINLKEDWIFKYRLYNNEDPNSYTYINNFIPRHTGSISLSANTKLYGIFPFKISRIESFRHVISPSIGFSWKPDFSKPLFGYNFNYFQWINGEPYDKFYGSMAGSTSKQEQKTMSFSLNNQFQAKVINSENQFSKIDLFTWNISSSYNFAADSLNLAPFRSSIRTTLPGGFKLDLSMTHDLYKLKLDSTDYLRRTNDFGPPRLTSASCGTSLRLQGKKTNYIYNADSTNKITNNETQNLWESTLSFRYALNQSIYGNKINNNKTFWMNSSFKINITEKWSVQHTARFDLIAFDMLYHKFYISRPLHCWIFSFDWTPSGPSKGFYLKINVKNPDLQDIKLESRGGRSFYGF